MALTPQKAKPFTGPLARTTPTRKPSARPKQTGTRPPAKATDPRTPGTLVHEGAPDFLGGKTIWDTPISWANKLLQGPGSYKYNARGETQAYLPAGGDDLSFLNPFNDQGRKGQDPLSGSSSLGEAAQTVMYDVLGHYGVSNFEFNEMVGLDPFDRTGFIDQWAESVIPAIGTPGGYPDMATALRDLEAYTKKIVVDYKNATGAAVGAGGIGTEGLTSDQVEKMIQDAMTGSFDPGQAASSYYY